MSAALHESRVGQNAIEMSLEDATRAKIAEGEEAAVVAGDRFVFGPVRLSNGLAPGVLRFTIGYGRKRAGAIGNGSGFNASALRDSTSAWITGGASLRRSRSHGNLSPSTPACSPSPARHRNSRRFSGRERRSRRPRRGRA